MLEEKRTNLQPNNNCIQIQNRLPVLPEDIETHIPLEIDIWMVDLLRALDLGRIMGEVLVDDEVEMECTSFVHAFVRFDCEGEIEDVIGIREGYFHCTSEGEFLQVFISRQSQF